MKILFIISFIFFFIELSTSQTLKATHFWDCSGMGCDATTLQPWNPSKYVASPGYAPQDPNAHGGPIYGEKLWMVGAASDTLANLLGSDDGCCGRDSSGSKGCGKCILVTNPNAVNSNWKVVVMKKNRCPPESNGCGAGNAHMDFAAPGFDVEQYSLSNTCSLKTGTGFTRRQDSFICGEWYKSYSSTQGCKSKCSVITNSEIRLGCERFAEWGWKSGDPVLTYSVVACPPKFREWISKQFDKNGVVLTQSPTTKPSTTTRVPVTTTKAPVTTTKAPVTTTKAPVTTTKAPVTTIYKVTKDAGTNTWYVQFTFSFLPSRIEFTCNGVTTVLEKSTWSEYCYFGRLTRECVNGLSVKFLVTLRSGSKVSSTVSAIPSTIYLTATNTLEEEELNLDD